MSSRTLDREDRMIFVRDIQRTVARHRQVSPAHMQRRSPSGCKAKDKPPIALARQEAMFLSVRLTKHSRSRLAQFFGLRDNTTVTYSVNKVERRIANDPAERAFVEQMFEELRA